MNQTLQEFLEPDKKHFHYFIRAGNKTDIENQIKDTVGIEIKEAENEEQALNKAKERIKRDIYILVEIRECFVCISHEKQMEIQEEMLKLLKKHLE